jgi:hypothetical protein
MRAAISLINPRNVELYAAIRWKENSETTRRNSMNRRILTSAVAAFVLLIGAAFAVAQQFGTAAEAKAMLEKAVAALKANEVDALAKFNSPTGGFRDRDLYVFCFDMTTGKFNAHVNPALMGTDARALKVNGQPVGQMVYDAAKEGAITTVDYDFPKPGTTQAVPKESYVTRVGNEGCGVGYYK